jgi:hypothetical protein
LLCPQQIGYATDCPADGFNATSTNQILTVHREQTTLHYDATSNLPILFTTSGIQSFQCYHANIAKSKAPPSHPLNNLSNLTKLQCRKLYLHECCAHESFGNLNQWIKEGCFKDIPTSLANVEDPQCITCNFGKACHKSHNSIVDHISLSHTKPGDGMSSDGMEAATLGRPFTTKGQPSTLHFKYASFWAFGLTTRPP